MTTTTVKPTKPLAIVDGPATEAALLQRYITNLGEVRGELSILEAGCGAAWCLQLPGVRYVLTGVDLNKDALDIRKYKQRDLHEAILGDLRTIALAENKYDVIYNSFVLEHIPGAELALDNLRRALSPGGLLILRIPDPRSVYGFLSKLTPFRFHVFYKRTIAGVKTAGLPGHDPFPTIYDPIVSREGIRDWCIGHGLKLREEVGWNYRIGRPGLMSALVSVGTKALSLLSLGALSARHVNLTYVIEKPAADDDSPTPAPAQPCAQVLS